MIHNTFRFILSLFITLLLPTNAIFAVVQEAGSGASIIQDSRGQAIEDTRIRTLESYLKRHGSPLTQYAGYFISEADRLGLDWRLVASIAGVESTFGKFLPKDSYNAWGWGIFTGKSDGIHFASWADGIRTVSEGLKYNYVDKGLTTVESMGSKYAASGSWAKNVSFFMAKIDAHELLSEKELTLMLTL